MAFLDPVDWNFVWWTMRCSAHVTTWSLHPELLIEFSGIVKIGFCSYYNCSAQHKHDDLLLQMQYRQYCEPFKSFKICSSVVIVLLLQFDQYWYWTNSWFYSISWNEIVEICMFCVSALMGLSNIQELMTAWHLRNLCSIKEDKNTNFLLSCSNSLNCQYLMNLPTTIKLTKSSLKTSR